MARSISSDPLLDYNFCLCEIPVPTIAAVAFPFKSVQSIMDKNLVSFKSIELPTVTNNIVKVQEGNNPFEHKVLQGFSSVSDVVISQAVTSLNLDFYLWFYQATSGASIGAPRRNFIVIQTRQDKLIPRKLYVLRGCLPIMWKLPSLNADNSSVSIESLTISVESVEPLPGLVDI